MGRKIAEIQEEINWHWRNTMRPIRFGPLDAKAAIPFCFLLFYARLSTLIIAIVVTSLFMFLEKKGLTFEAALRSVRVYLLGAKRPALMSLRYRRLKDYG
jgi:intracellular multiplication protein IcmT